MEPTYTQGFITNPDEVLRELQQLDWQRRENTPRSEYYINDFPEPYTYGSGRGRRTYQPQPKPAIVLRMQEALKTITGHWLDVCFLNRYLDQRDQLGWHADNSPEMDDARPIAVVSLGAERELWTRRSAVPEDVTVPLGGSELRRHRLASGSLFLMPPGFQDTHQHRIPKADRAVGERISLTFRGYVRG